MCKLAGVSSLELYVFLQNLNIMGSSTPEKIEIAMKYWEERGGGSTGEVDNAFREELQALQDVAHFEANSF